MLVSLQKLFVRPQRYQLSLRLGFYFYVLYNSQVDTLFSLFKKGVSSKIPFLLVSFCDFFSKEFFSLLSFYSLSIFQSSDQTTYCGTDNGLQVFYRRTPKLYIAREALPRVTGCIISKSSILSLDCLSFVLQQQKPDFQLKYMWTSSFCTLVRAKKSALVSSLTGVSYLRFFVSLNFMEGMFCCSFRGRFLALLCLFPKMLFNFLFYFTFFNKQKVI